MKLLMLISLLSAGHLIAGTPDNSDVTYIYSFFMLILLVMLAYDFISKLLRIRRERFKQMLDSQEHKFGE